MLTLLQMSCQTHTHCKAGALSGSRLGHATSATTQKLACKHDRSVSQRLNLAGTANHSTPRHMQMPKESLHVAICPKAVHEYAHVPRQCTHHMQCIGIHNLRHVGLHCQTRQGHTAVLHISLGQHLANQSPLLAQEHCQLQNQACHLNHKLHMMLWFEAFNSSLTYVQENTQDT